MSDMWKQAWMEDDADQQGPSMHNHGEASLSLREQVRRRNLREKLMAALIVGVMCAIAITTSVGLLAAGCALTAAGAIYVIWQLGVRTEYGKDDFNLPAAQHLRNELERQRRALATVGTWYVLPFAPGLLTIAATSPVTADAGHKTFALIGSALAIGLMLVVVAAILRLNRRAAAKLEAAIAAIDSDFGA